LLQGGGGNFLNELNKGPTYSQLLGSGGGFNKAGILSGILGSSSGTAVSYNFGIGEGSISDRGLVRWFLVLSVVVAAFSLTIGQSRSKFMSLFKRASP